MALAATPKLALRGSASKRGLVSSKATTSGKTVGRSTTSGRGGGNPGNGRGSDNQDYLKSLPGVTQPFPDVFDPANLAASASVKDIRRWRESEVTHGRVAMLAALGFIVQENIKDSENFNFLGGKIVGPAIYHFQQIRQGFWEPLLVAIGLAESYRVTVGWATPVGGQFNALRDDYDMGNLGFDPLGIAPKDPEEFKDMQTKELNNGRLAMIAIAGFTVQELLFQREFLVIPALHDAATPNIEGAPVPKGPGGLGNAPSLNVFDNNVKPPTPSYLPGGARNAAQGVKDAADNATGGLFKGLGQPKLPDVGAGARDVANSAKNAADNAGVPTPPNPFSGFGQPKLPDVGAGARDVANSAKNAADNVGLPNPGNLFKSGPPQLPDVGAGARDAANAVKDNLPNGVPTPSSFKDALPDVGEGVKKAGDAVKNALPDGVPSPQSFKQAAQDNLPKPDPTAGSRQPFLTMPGALQREHLTLMDIPNPFKLFTDPPADPTIAPVPTEDLHTYDTKVFNNGDPFSRTPEAPRIGAPPSNQPIPANPNGDGGVDLQNSANPMKPAGLPGGDRMPFSTLPSGLKHHFTLADLPNPFKNLLNGNEKLPEPVLKPAELPDTLKNLLNDPATKAVEVPGGARLPHLTLADLPNPFKALSDNVPDVPKGNLPEVPKITNQEVNIDLPKPNLPNVPNPFKGLSNNVDLPKGLPEVPKITNKDVNVDLPNLPKPPSLPNDFKSPLPDSKIATPGVQGGPPSVPLRVPSGIPTK